MINLAGGAVLSSLAIFLLLRYRHKMTSLLTWIVGSLRSQQVSSTSNKDSDKSNNPKSQSTGDKVNQKLKNVHDDPTFSTSLVTPIEDIIEETINDEVKPPHRKKGKSTTKTSLKSEQLSKKNKTRQEQENDIGYSLSKNKTATKVNSYSKSKKLSVVDVSEEYEVDDTGFFFLPVKEKGKKYKNKVVPEKKDKQPTLSAVLDQAARKTKVDLSQSSVIDHFKKRRGNEKFPSKKLITKTEKLHNSVSSVVEKRLLYESQIPAEPKESKKVTSNVSYASIVLNSVSDISSQLDHDNTVNPNDTTANGPVAFVEDETIINSIKTESNSSSIEVLSEYNIDTQDVQVANFEIIEKKLNSLVNEENELEHNLTKKSNLIETKVQDSSSKHSSICILDNQDEFEESQETSNIGLPLDIDVRFGQESSYVFNEDKSASIIDFQENLKISKVGTTNSVYNFNNNYHQSEVSQNNYSQFCFETKIQNFLVEERSDVASSYTYDQTFNLTQESVTSRNFSEDFSSTGHSFTELLENSYSPDTSLNYFQPKELPSNFLGFQDETKEHLAHNPTCVADSESSSQKDLLQTSECLVVTDTSDDFSHLEALGEATNLPKENGKSQSRKEEHPVEKTENEPIEQPFVEKNTNTVGTFIYEEKSAYNFEEKSNGYRVQENFEKEEEQFPHITASEDQSHIEEEEEEDGDETLTDKINQLIEEKRIIQEDQDKDEIAKPSTTISESIIQNQIEANEELNNSCKEEEIVERVSVEKSISKGSEDTVKESENQIEKEAIIDELVYVRRDKKETQPEKEIVIAKTFIQFERESIAEEQNPLVEVEDVTEIKPIEEGIKVVQFKKDNIIRQQSTFLESEIQFSQNTRYNTTKATKKESGIDKFAEVLTIEQLNKFIEKEKSTEKLVARIEEDPQNNQSNFEKMPQTRVLTLNDHEHQECTLYRIEKKWVIQFRIGPSLFGRNIFLYCNYPKDATDEFSRNEYYLMEWVTDEGCENADDTALFTQIKADLAGSFHYYFTYDKGEHLERQGSGYFLVDPVLKYGNNEDLPLDCIQCQTVLTKSLGSFSSWEKKLQVTRESGYNMVHFTPIQELGESNSSYSLSEQLKLNTVFRKSDGKMPTFEEVEHFTAKLRKEWKMTSICDIVLNHTANESKWIQEHPEVTYNCVNCPYMRPAYLLDAAYAFFSSEVKKGFYEDKGILPEVNNEDHLNAIRYHFQASILDSLKIHEMFICDTNRCVSEFLTLARNTEPKSQESSKDYGELKLIQDPEFRRLATTVDLKLALKVYNAYRNDTFDEDSRLKKCAEQFKSKLDELNNSVINEINGHLTVGIDNVIAGIRYYRVQHDGPKFKDISIKTPLVYRYFTDYGSPKTLKEFEEIMYSDKGKFLMAHNGWVMNSDPLKNFAAADSKVYLRRELIAWGDSVKLRFGEKPEDCPFLWDYMRKYVEQTARIFDGVRLDNCHSTPLPVAEYLLDCARKVRPDLYVVAELFTNSDMTDNIFVNRLGITSLIREAMSAWDSHEEGRLVYRYGGSPVGSFHQPNIRPLVPSIAHALFLDQTHDNPSPVDKRSVFDLLPSTALVNMACCASGSNRGYDELVPHHIHVVDEDREYTEWTNEENLSMGNLRYVTHRSGIIKAKKAVNDLHFLLGKEGFNQVYVDQMDADIVAVTRHCPVTHQSYILVAFTAFSHPNEDAGNYQREIKPLRFEGVLEEIVLEANLSHVNHKSGGSKFFNSKRFVKDSKWINGHPEYFVSVKQHIQVSESETFEKVNSGTQNVTQLNFKNFKPGSIVVVKASLPETMSTAVKTVRNLISTMLNANEAELTKIVNRMKLSDMNRALYRCDQEERDEGFGFDTYNIPNFRSMVYTGLQGIMSLLANIRPNNDLGHPMCANLRDGNWMIDYIWKRLKLDPGTQELGEWIEKATKSFANIPRYLVPCYFDLIVTGVYLVLIEKSHRLMSKFVANGSTFVRGLALGSIQFGAYIKSADLPTLSPNLAPPLPPTRKNKNNETVQTCVSLSAGLPHFSVGYMRNWGRDTFIALRGLFILTGRYQEAREHILGYAACMRHGLIPNLLDGGRNPRFNCRDAIWWWLYCIKEYVNAAPEGIKILSDKVSRIFPTDDAQNQPPGAIDQPLHDVIQEGLKIHFQGLSFRERNAGRQIDEHMTDHGFNNQIGVHPDTGFIFGGNKWNCGTWMDKMGSSDKAGNRGKPATPRDGSAVELIGLSKAVISWLAKLSDEHKYPYKGVERTHKNGKTTQWTFKEWASMIQNNFEKYFWVNSKPTENEIRPDLINKRGIYKDSYGSSLEYTDFQLRCNFPIAMVAAPELFTPSHAWEALNQAEKYLLGPLGMKTLDPSDWAYRGDYDNSNQSDDSSIANGFNYHQGPEWVWPIGFFLRAKLIFAAQNGALKETLAQTKLILSKHFVELQTSDWRGLPELTNTNGAYCRDSSRTQAWSMSCVLEVLFDLKKIESSLDLLDN